MTAAPDTARHIRRAGHWHGASTQVALSYEDRFLRRKRLETDRGDILVDLSETVSLNHGDALELTDGRLIEIVAAPEPLLAVTGPDLLRYVWHIGNRHAPCAMSPDRLLIREDAVMAEMLRQLGATVTPVSEPFTPEGGAYGHGRTLPHAH